MDTTHKDPTVGDLAEFLRAAREEFGDGARTPDELDEQLGLPQGTVAGAESGTARPPQDLVGRLLEHLRANVEYGRALWLRARWRSAIGGFEDGEVADMSVEDALRIVRNAEAAGQAADDELGYHDPGDPRWIEVMLAHVRLLQARAAGKPAPPRIRLVEPGE